MKEKDKEFLDLLSVVTPDSGWNVAEAYLASYSLDLKALGLTLMAMAGTWEQDGESPKRIDAIKAIDSMRGKVHVVVQPTRTKTPDSNTPKILHLLDQFCHEYKSDLDFPHSWHPKIALVKFMPPENHSSRKRIKRPQPKWRLWIGSKNLTLTKNLDLGVVIDGEPSRKSTNAPDIAKLATTISQQASLPGKHQETLLAELDKVQWKLPRGLTLQQIALLRPEDREHRDYPKIPRHVKEILLVSPFLDIATLKHFNDAGNKQTQRTLVSTRTELDRLKETGDWNPHNYQLHTLPTAVMPKSLDNSEDATDQQLADELQNEVTENLTLGLHAKFILACTPNSYLLWMGSINATKRGWRRNAEVLGEFKISKSIYLQLRTIIDDAVNIDDKQLEIDYEQPEEDSSLEAEQKLRDAHAAIESWITKQPLQLEQVNNTFILEANIDLHKLKLVRPVTVKCGMQGSELATWPAGATQLTLGDWSTIELNKRTANIHFQLSYNGKTKSFITKSKFTSLEVEKRDRSAFSRYLTPNAFLELIFWDLSGTRRGSGGGSWDQANGVATETNIPSTGRSGTTIDDKLPTVDMLLKAWAIDRTVLDRVEHHVKTMRNLITASSTKWTEDEKTRIDMFAKTFEQIKEGLKKKPCQR